MGDRIPHGNDAVELRRAIQRLENTYFDASSDVDHDATTNFVANEHIDHTSVSVIAGTGLSGGGDISSDRTLALSHLGIESLGDPDDDRILFWDDSETACGWLDLDASLSITDTTLSVSAAGVDHGSLAGLGDDDHTQYLLADGTRDLTGNLAVDAAVTIDGRDISDDGTKLDTVEENADVTDADNVAAAGAAMDGGAHHNGFSDFVADEHIDHSSVSVIAGTGLSGGGTIEADRTLALSHLGIESLGDPDDDRILFWDDSETACGWLDLGSEFSISGADLTIASGNLTSVTNNNANTAKKGTPVYSVSSGTVDFAQADAEATSRVIGLAFESITAGGTGNVQTAGVLEATTAEWDNITGAAGGLTAGSVYYVDPDTAGLLTAILPTTTGDWIAPVGRAISTTEMKILIQRIIEL